jgi:hypothetical protein
MRKKTPVVTGAQSHFFGAPTFLSAEALAIAQKPTSMAALLPLR